MADDTSTATPAKPRRKAVEKFRAVVAAARRVNLDSSEAIKATVSKRQTWQEDYWAYYDEMPEVKFAQLFLSNGMQRVRFFAATRDENNQLIPINHPESPLHGTDLAVDAEHEMNRVRNGVSGQGEINRLLTLNLEGPGECHLHGMAAVADIGVRGVEGYVPGRPEMWDVRSVSEIEFSDRVELDPATGISRPKILIKRSPDDKGRDFDYRTEQLVRFWQRHPRFTEWADSHSRAVMGDCEMLTLLAGEAKAISKSRHTAGAFTLPSELDFVDADDQDDGDPETREGEPKNPFVEAFMAHQVDPITDPSSPSSVQRLIISGPAEYLKPDVLRPIDLGRTADDKLTEKMERHVNRLARGLNVPVEVVMGHMSTTFSNAERIDQDKFDDHFQPRCVSIADGYCFGFLRPNLADRYTAEDLELVEVAYDPSELVRDESMENKADALLAAGAISLAAYRRYKGANETDAPDDNERLRNLVERKAILTGDLVMALFKKVGIDLGLTVSDGKISEEGGPVDEIDEGEEIDEPEADDAEDDDETDDAVTAAARPESDTGHRLMMLDRSMRTRLAGAAEMALARALERAGNKLKTSGPPALRASLRQIPSRRAAAHVGPSLIADAGIAVDDLLEGAWVDLEQQFKQWGNETGDAAIAEINKLAKGRFTKKELADLKVRQVADIDEAWQWMSSSLDDVARHALFDPLVQAAETLGEIDTASKVPTGLLREALVRAGGATGFQSRDGVIEPTNKVPLGGIATGERMLSAAEQAGAAMEGFVWVYGAASRQSFEPHLRLAGKFFWNFDDHVLRNNGTWPSTSHFYPGDHKGCVCDFSPQIYATPNLEQNAGPSTPRRDAGFATGDEAAKALTSKGHVFTADQKRAMRDYQSAGAQEINDALRKGIPIDEMPAEYSDLIRGLDATMAPLPAAVRVERGLPMARYMNDLDEGDRLSDAAYLSTSTRAEQAAEFAHGYKGGGAVMRIDVPKGTRGVWANNVDDLNAGEQELILPRGAELEVVSITKEKRTIGVANPIEFTVTVIHTKVV